MASAMPREGVKDYVSLEEWEHCLKIVSYCVLRIGPAVAPILERVEREVERAHRNDPMVRARQHLEALAADLAQRAKPIGGRALIAGVPEGRRRSA
jgi:hypothetical protein